jgi:hypothetical protein
MSAKIRMSGSISTDSKMLKELEALKAVPEDEIDTDDIPEAAAENMRQGVRGALFRPIKTPVTIRLDAESSPGSRKPPSPGNTNPRSTACFASTWPTSNASRPDRHSIGTATSRNSPF